MSAHVIAGCFRGMQVNGSCSEKVIKLDAKQHQYHIVVIGEEPHLAYNRVTLSSFFEHRNVEDLYLNPKEWVRVRHHI